MVVMPVQPPRQAAELSEEDQLKFQEMAMQLLDRTLRDLDEHDVEPRPHDKQDPRLWKKIHHKDHFTTYTRCDDAPEATYVAADGGRSTTSRPSKDCPLSELMYGVFMGNSQAMALKSAVVDKNIGNRAILKQLMGPTEEDPFRGLKCVRLEASPEAPALYDVATRASLSATRCTTRSTTRPSDGLRRTRIVIGSIYRERPNGTVWTVPDFAYAKKLRWCIDHRVHSNSVKAFHAKLAKRCASCDKSVANKIWQSRAAHRVCNLCKAPLCSSCRVKKDLYEIDPYFRARKFPIRICPPCREFIKQLDAKEVQRQEMLRPQRPDVLNPLTPSTLDALARNFSLDNSFCTASVESLCMLDSPRARSDSFMTDLLN
ncbi:Zinc finger, FYVE/PHD-type [Phytophthora cactorum]|nr:Zinc finger, FYVE/PHD-type [Phytophthora cactorum]